MSEITPVLRETLVSLPELISDHLRNSIITGELLPGAALRQEQIAEKFQVSRVPVREALKLLESEGLIVLRPRRGYVVSALDLEEIREIFDIRMLLEGHAASLAAISRTEEDIEAVEDILRQLDEIIDFDPEAVARWAALNRAFHERVNLSSGRQHLCRIASTVRASVERYVRADASMAQNFEYAQGEHRDIVEALKAKDSDLAGALTRAHCQNTRDRLLDSISKKITDAVPA